MRSRGTKAACFTLTLMSSVGLMACAPQGAEVGEGGGDVVNYRVATIEGVGTPMDNAFKKFIDEVKTCSDGTLVGTNYPAGQLGGFVDLIDGNRQGTYEISMGGFDVEGAKSPKLAALSMGYVFEDEEHVERAIDEMLDEFSDELRRTTGVAIIGMGEDGWRWTFANRPVHTVNDLRGLHAETPCGRYTGCTNPRDTGCTNPRGVCARCVTHMPCPTIAILERHGV